MIVWMMCSSTPFDMETSTFANLIVQLPVDLSLSDDFVELHLFSGSSVTGMIVNFCCGIRKAPPLIDTCIVPRGAKRF